MKNSIFSNLLMTAVIIAATSVGMRCYADNPIIQSKYTADSDTAVNNANGFSTQKTGSARNPIIWADFPDPAVIRVDDTYYMSNTTMHMCPGLPSMKSKNLVNWDMVGYAYQKLEDNDETTLQNGRNMLTQSIWAGVFGHS